MFVLSWIKFFRGYVYVHLTGYATERFLNLCGSRNILIWNLKPTEDGYYFYISVDGYRSLKPILKKTKTKARILKKYGVPFQLFRYRKHKVFAAGIAVSAVLLFYCSGYVWNIEVKGILICQRRQSSRFYRTKMQASVCQKEISTAKNWKKNCVLHTVKSSGLR